MPFAEASGTTASDAAGPHDGSLIGGASFDPTGGRFGGCVTLDGIDNLVSVPDLGELRFGTGDPFTLAGLLPLRHRP